MDYRKESFTRRFKSAMPHLQAPKIQEVISIKYRDDCVSSSIYDRLADDIRPHEMAVEVQPLSGEFGGRAWLAKDRGKGRAILVEHETGLEILGAVGSVASLIALIPMISAAWKKLRGHFFGARSRPFEDRPVEIRRIDDAGNLVEEHATSVEIYVLNLTLQHQNELENKIAALEQQVKRLKRPTPKKALKPKRKPKKK